MSKEIFTNLSREELEKLIEKAVDQSVIKNLNNQSDDSDDLIKTPEAMSILQVSRTTLHKYVNEGIVRSYQLGSRVFFSRKELVESVKNSSND